MTSNPRVRIIKPHSFEAEQHFYPKALNSTIHPLVEHFFNLSIDRIVSRYVHLNPMVDPAVLSGILQSRTSHFFWGGADLFYVTTDKGNRKMVVLETNSCPSGQKSMPSSHDADEHRGYHKLISESFLSEVKRRKLPEGRLAVIYDKNLMETSGYAATIAELTGEDVYLIPHFDGEEQFIRFEDGVMIYKDESGVDHPIRAAFRYVTQKPWNRIPVQTKTFIFNSTLVCLAGGRNKLLASKAYELFNGEIAGHGLKILYPETVRDVSKPEIPLWVDRFGGRAVIKVPYSNAGQGVYTVTNQAELDAFMEQDFSYDQFIVQALIGHSRWSSQTSAGTLYHIGTIPNKKGNIYVADVRMMVCNTPSGFKPIAIYARRARSPLEEELHGESWDVLGTNLSVKVGKNQWDSETSRLMLMDRKDFNTLGVGIDDLIEGFIETVLSVLAIDQMASRLIGSKGNFKSKLFKSLDRDERLFSEILLS